MDKLTLLGAALAFSVIALPLVFHLYDSGLKKDMLILEAKINKEFKERMEKFEEELTIKFNAILSEINHKKVTAETLGKISLRLERVVNKIDPKGNMNLYDLEWIN